jgi:hypothetical protein
LGRLHHDYRCGIIRTIVPVRLWAFDTYHLHLFRRHLQEIGQCHSEQIDALGVAPDDGPAGLAIGDGAREANRSVRLKRLEVGYIDTRGNTARGTG